MRTSSYRLVTSAAALAAALVVTPAAAQGDPADIVVTAQRRAEKQVDVPITITNVSAQQLADTNINQLSDVSRVAPALRFDNSAAFAQPSIRGVGTAVTSAGAGANVGIYVDGFYSPNPLAADFQLMKLQSVQVLKGPQGTLFGRNTTGGAILLTTAAPSTTPGVEVKATYSRFDALRLQGYATYGLTDTIAADIEGLYSKGDGFVHNVTTGSDRDGAYRNWSVRGGLLIEPSDDFSILLRYTHADNDDPTAMNTNIFSDSRFGVGTQQPAGTYVTDPDLVATSGPSEFFNKTDIFQMTVKGDLGFADLTSYTQYRTEDSLLVEDLDHTAVPAFLLHIGVKDETLSQEVLFSSKPGGRLQWTAGVFYLLTRDAWTINLGTPTPTDRFANIPFGRSRTSTESIAAFADLTYELTPQLFLTAGGRYAHDEVKDAFYTNGNFPDQGFPPDLKGNKFTPRVVLRFKPTDQTSVYASYSKGYKAGLLDVGNADPALGPNDRRVKPENLTAYEVGFKYDDRRLSFDLSAYYYDYKDLQVSVFKGTAQAQVINAADSRIWGLDGQARYEIVDGLDFNIGGAYTHARYHRFDEAPIYTPFVSEFFSGFVTVPTPLRNVTMQRVPAFTGNVGGRYKTEVAGGQLALSTNLYYSSHFYFGPSGTQFRQKGYEVLALKAEWTDPSEHFTIGVFGDNVTNSRYRTQVVPNAFGIGNTWSSPTTYGVQLGAKF